MGREREPGDRRAGGVEHGKALAGAPWGRSALNLRLLLAGFGLVICVGLGVLSWAVGYPWLGVVLFVLAAVALVDLVVVGRRVKRRRERGEHHTLFE
ncbi:DUF6343 family protein [Actinomadura flavalba]|uniref:DUF6343 family protein n=1 Tax=Actinomadura flavalba TaxID=1120938 RepID=UPI00037408D5|nr:DUF6343 family protein [Actinomadura flavalba]